jgi:hypothetical protein
MQKRNSGKPHSAICIVIDRLSAGFLGAFGNAWIRTPQFDRLASQSLVFDQAIIDSPRLEQAYRGYWCGQHAAIARNEPSPDVLSVLHRQAVHSVLLTDDDEVANFEVASNFSDTIHVDVDHRQSPCDVLEETHFAKYFAAAIDALLGIDAPSLLWMHMQGLAGSWDAPLEFRNAYSAEDDPEPPTGVEVPHFRLADDYDPDDLLGIMHSYAGQVTLLDTCLGAFIQAVDESPLGENALLVVVSPRGFPLGEHLNVGAHDDHPPLYSELVNVPWLVRFPGGRHAACRSLEFMQPDNLYRALLSPSGIETAGKQTKNRAVVVSDSGETGIRTPAWYLKSRTDGRQELFRKPDDRWDVSDVSDLCPDIVERLQAVFDQSQQGEMNMPLDELLVSGIE